MPLRQAAGAASGLFGNEGPSEWEAETEGVQCVRCGLRSQSLSADHSAPHALACRFSTEAKLGCLKAGVGGPGACGKELMEGWGPQMSACRPA